ncbi:MAG TPA: flagellar motor stator protein MotA [Bdellovibrionota bacterium]|nr:flagellar motor stator protein MotA [Bdellovibrionota bacterium]
MGFVGLLVLFGTVFGGFFMAGGASSIGVFLHPGEYVTIIGASIAALIIATPSKYISQIVKMGIGSLSMKDKSKAEFLQALQLMFELFSAQKKDGLQAIEGHIENPESSTIFQKYPKILNDHHACDFISDSMRTFISGGPSPYDMDDLLTADIEIMHTEEHKIPAQIQTTADGFPAIGIVAAVLGVIITMGSISAGPEVVGGKVAAALVGTFLGIFVGYGIVGPMATRLNHHLESEGVFYNVLKAGILANCRGLPPQISIEFARRSIYVTERPSFQEVEEACKNAGSAGGAQQAA